MTSSITAAVSNGSLTMRLKHREKAANRMTKSVLPFVSSFGTAYLAANMATREKLFDALPEVFFKFHI